MQVACWLCELYLFIDICQNMYNAPCCMVDIGAIICNTYVHMCLAYKPMIIWHMWHIWPN